jgi:exportin-2 (importin alpha re-exporter)
MSSNVMQQYSATIFTLLLTRLNDKPSAHFKQGVVYFVGLLCALDRIGPDFVIGVVDGLQPG